MNRCIRILFNPFNKSHSCSTHMWSTTFCITAFNCSSKKCIHVLESLWYRGHYLFAPNQTLNTVCNIRVLYIISLVANILNQCEFLEISHSSMSQACIYKKLLECYVYCMDMDFFKVFFNNMHWVVNVIALMKKFVIIGLMLIQAIPD